jgi:hypothetical protein
MNNILAVFHVRILIEIQETIGAHIWLRNLKLLDMVH